MARPLYRELAALLQAIANCRNSSNAQWENRHQDQLTRLVSQHMPHGSGFDNGTKLDRERSNPERLVFSTSYHHMNSGGMYDGWTEHTITITPSLASGFNMRISGRNRNDIKEMMSQEFDAALNNDVTYYLLFERFPQFKLVGRWENEDGTPSQCYQAWYCQGKRFWNNFTAARDYAASMMESSK